MFVKKIAPPLLIVSYGSTAWVFIACLQIHASDQQPTQPMCASSTPKLTLKRRAQSDIEQGLRNEIATLSRALAAEKQANLATQNALQEKDATIERVEGSRKHIVKLWNKGADENLALKQQNFVLHGDMKECLVWLECVCKRPNHTPTIKLALEVVAKHKADNAQSLSSSSQ